MAIFKTVLIINFASIKLPSSSYTLQREITLSVNERNMAATKGTLISICQFNKDGRHMSMLSYVPLYTHTGTTEYTPLACLAHVIPLTSRTF